MDGYPAMLSTPQLLASPPRLTALNFVWSLKCLCLAEKENAQTISPMKGNLLYLALFQRSQHCQGSVSIYSSLKLIPTCTK